MRKLNLKKEDTFFILGADAAIGISTWESYEKLGDYEISIRYLNRIVEEDPLYEKAWISIAKYYLRNNDHDKAIENLNMALNIISKNY